MRIEILGTHGRICLSDSDIANYGNGNVRISLITAEDEIIADEVSLDELERAVRALVTDG